MIENNDNDIHVEPQIDILIVEDSATQATQLANMLSSYGYHTRVAENGRLGLQAARAEKPILILSDISMPEMDGFELCRELKKDPQLSNVPVILLTALTSLYDVLKALDCGADNFIRKPVEKKYLMGRIRHILANRATRDDERVQLGMKISLGGQTHFITAERQQIFDLLISTYEEAIQMTAELHAQQEQITRSYESLEGLYRMADALNPAVTEKAVLESALGRALDLPDVEGGCIMLLDEESRLRPVVSENFFPEGAEINVCHDCTCCRKLSEGAIREPLTVEDCQLATPPLRSRAPAVSHVTVPLVIGDKVLGVLNLRTSHDVAAPQETLHLFDAVGKQVAIALERAGLYTNMEALVRERTDALEIERNMLSAVVSTAGALVLLVDAAGRIIMFNPACEKSLGWKSDEAIGRFYWDVFLPADGQKGRNTLFEDMPRRDMPVQISADYQTRDGSKRHIIWNVSYVQRPDKSVEYYLATGVDVTELRAAEERLQFLNNFDRITGLPNRMYLMARLRVLQESGIAREGVIGIMMTSFSRLPAVRDGVGSRGDLAIMTETAARLKKWVKGDDIAARLGDHTFAVALVRSDPSDIASAAREVLSVLDEPFAIDGQELHLEARGGIAVFPNDGKEIEVLIDFAELAMQRVLVSASERYEFYTPAMNQRANEEFQLENALRGALKRDELFLHYQPQVDMATGDIIGLEALLRWQHPTLGVVSPARFIALAEETGLILPIGDWVLRTACAQTKAWQDAGLDAFRIAVNLSARQFAQNDLVQRIANILQQYGLPPERLDIELTESLLMHDVERAVQVLHELRALGVQISIDDFGTGYSSLSYLKRFPIDVLKIDRSFVSEIPAGINDATIADAIISMAHSLGLKVIAEGVENEPQCHFLRRNMCDVVQGYLFSKPLPAEQAEVLLKEHRRLPSHLLRLHKAPRTLLLVDDEPAVLSALTRKLRGKGYRILTASSGEGGLEVLAQNDVDVIISDQRMPGMTGVEFLRNVKTLYPDTVRIVLSGFTELQSVTDAVNEGAIYKFLTKPWEDEQLLAHIEEAFQHKEMVNENHRLNLEIRTANQELARANRQLEEGLAQQQRELRLNDMGMDVIREALAYLPSPVIGLDADSVIVYANPAAQELFGSQDKELLIGRASAQALPDLASLPFPMEAIEQCDIELNGALWDARISPVANGVDNRGALITLTPAFSQRARRRAKK